MHAASNHRTHNVPYIGFFERIMQISENCFVTKFELSSEEKEVIASYCIHSVFIYLTLEKQIRFYSLAIILECRDCHWETLRTVTKREIAYSMNQKQIKDPFFSKQFNRFESAGALGLRLHLQ